MFCNQCGRQNPDDAAFCLSCGQNLRALASGNAGMMGYQQPSYIQDRMNIRNNEIAEMNRMIEYFSQKRNQYAEYDAVCSMLDLLSKGKRKGLLIWGIILVSLGVFLIFISIGMLVSGSSGSRSSYSSTSGISIIVTYLISFVGPGTVLIILFIVTSRARDRNGAIASRRYDELTTELYQHYLAYGYCPVGCEYTNPSNLMVILQTIQSGRADTTKDAINVLAEENYRRNMQAIAMQTARSAAAAARGASTAAVFSAANFFLR